MYLCVFKEYSVSTKVHSYVQFCGCDGGVPYLNYAAFVLLHPSSCVPEIEMGTKVVKNLSEPGPLSFHV